MLAEQSIKSRLLPDAKAAIGPGVQLRKPETQIVRWALHVRIHTLFAYYQQRERVGHDRRARPRIIGCGCGGRAEFRRDRVDRVGCGIDFHSARATLRSDRVYERELGGRILVCDRDRAVAARSKRVASPGIEAICVDALPDRNRAEDFAGVAVDERHQFVVATNDKALVGSVNGEAGGRFAGRERPGLFHF